MFDRMSPEKLARAKGQAQKTNELNQLAHQANGFETSRADQRAAEQRLVRALGPRKARKLIKAEADKAAGQTPRRWF